jgi:hypothetical protein
MSFNRPVWLCITSHKTNIHPTADQPDWLILNTNLGWYTARSHSTVLQQKLKSSIIITLFCIWTVAAATVPSQLPQHVLNKYCTLHYNGEKLSFLYDATLFSHYKAKGLWVPAQAPSKTHLTLRLLMSYIHGAPILDVSRSHTMTHHSR